MDPEGRGDPLRVPLYRHTHFPSDGEDPLSGMVSLVDAMLVFACGLIAALMYAHGREPQPGQGVQIEKRRELPALPRSPGQPGSGYEAVGRVFRDPESGKLILVGDAERALGRKEGTR